jgi:hypothetical protein
VSNADSAEVREASSGLPSAPAWDLPLPGPLRLYVGLLVTFWGLSALPLVLRSKHLWSARPLWFQPPFFDFGCYYERIQLVHTPQFWTAPGPTWNYPAPGIFVYKLFYAFNRGHAGPHQVFYGFLAYLMFVAAVLLVACILLTRAMGRRGLRPARAVPFLAASLVLCWPIFFGMERGNIEFFLDAGVALGVWAYARRRWAVAAVLLGVFGAGKLYPLLLLSLFIPLRRWRALGLGCASAVAVSVFSSHWIGAAPVIANQTHGILLGMRNWVLEYSLTFLPEKMGYDHSILAFLKGINQSRPDRFAAWAIAYAVVASVGMLWLFFGRLWKLPRINQLLAVSVAAVLLPPTSFDYTLMLLVPVWVWMVLLAVRSPLGTDHSEGGTRRGLLVAMGVFAVLFAPETFAAWRGTFFAGQVKLFGLLALLAISALTPLAD